MKKFLLAIMIFVSSAHCFSMANSQYNGIHNKIKKLIEQIEVAFEQNSEVEYILLDSPKLPQLKHIQVDQSWFDNIEMMEVAAAILTEKYRKELGLYKAPNGQFWLTWGSVSGVLPPSQAMYESGEFDLVFHTHPERGGVRPSSEDFQVMAYDINGESDVVSMSGHKSRITSSFDQTNEVLFIPVTYDSRATQSNISRDIQLSLLVSLQDEFLAYRGFLSQNPDKLEIIRSEYQRLLSIAKSRSYIYHTSLSSVPLAKQIERELDQLN